MHYLLVGSQPQPRLILQERKQNGMFIAYDLDVKDHQTALSVPGVDDGWLELDPVSSVGSSNLRICFAQRRPQALQRVFGPSGP